MIEGWLFLTGQHKIQINFETREQKIISDSFQDVYFTIPLILLSLPFQYIY